MLRLFIVNFRSLYEITVDKWVNIFNEKMRSFYHRYFKDKIAPAEIEKHETIPINSPFTKIWLKPCKRRAFLDKFIIEKVQDGLNADEVNDVKVLITELEQQKNTSKYGENAVKSASVRAGLSYYTAKKYLRRIPKSYYRRYKFGKPIPKLTGLL